MAADTSANHLDGKPAQQSHFEYVANIRLHPGSPMNSVASTQRQSHTSKGNRLIRRPQRALTLSVPHKIPRRGPMRIGPRAFLRAIGLAASLLPGAASAGALVEFSNVSEQAPARLLGYLSRPDSGLSAVLCIPSSGTGPYAAVVGRHGWPGLFHPSHRVSRRPKFLGGW